MEQIIYLMNILKTIEQNQLQKKQESFLMNAEVIFYVKKQMKLEKNSKREAVFNFLKDKEQRDGLTDREKRVLKNIDRYLKNF